MLENLWHTPKEKIEQKSVFWNMMSSGLNSVVSMFLLWIVTMINGVSDAGIFSLAFSTSQMMLTIGNYGMRKLSAGQIYEISILRAYIYSPVFSLMLL